jgi:hypothetical protein
MRGVPVEIDVDTSGGMPSPVACDAMRFLPLNRGSIHCVQQPSPLAKSAYDDERQQKTAHSDLAQNACRGRRKAGDTRNDTNNNTSI